MHELLCNTSKYVYSAAVLASLLLPPRPGHGASGRQGVDEGLRLGAFWREISKAAQATARSFDLAGDSAGDQRTQQSKVGNPAPTTSPRSAVQRPGVI
jgi:hypothetical protein